MTIDELIIELERRREMHGGSTEVRTTWEGVQRKIEPENVYFTSRHTSPILWIDADENWNKPKDAV